MLYFGDADGTGTGNGCRDLVRFHCANDPDIPTLYAAKCEIWGAGSWHETRNYGPECAHGFDWERIGDEDVAHAQRECAAFYAEITGTRR
jgi:hypothetical protein